MSRTDKTTPPWVEQARAKQKYQPKPVPGWYDREGEPIGDLGEHWWHSVGYKCCRRWSREGRVERIMGRAPTVKEGIRDWLETATSTQQ